MWLESVHLSAQRGTKRRAIALGLSSHNAFLTTAILCYVHSQ